MRVQVIMASFNFKNKTKKFLKIINLLDSKSIEYRIGSAGGGNQLRQTYLKYLAINLSKSIQKH